MKSIYRFFNLVELLITCSILLVLISLLQPSLSRISEKGRQLVCYNNLKILTNAHLTYAEDFNGEQVSPTAYLTADGFANWPNVNNIPERSLLILMNYLPLNKDTFLCPSDSLDRKDGPSKYIRSKSFSYTRNGYVFNKNIVDVKVKTVLLAEEDELGPMNDGTFYANQWDLLSERHDGWAHMSRFDGSVDQLDTYGYNQQSALWRRDNYLLPK